MKKFLPYIFILLAALAAGTAHAQTNKANESLTPGGSWQIALPQANTGIGSLKYNYTRTWTPVEGSSTPPPQNMTPIDSRINTVYTNGWGQPVQANSHDFHGDIITPVDNRAMMDKPTYLSYPGPARSLFIPNAFSNQKAWYGSNYPEEGDNAYSRTKVIASGNDHSTGSYGPGAALTGNARGTVVTAKVNTAADDIRILGINGQYPYSIGTYAAGELMVKEMTGQHDAAAWEYTNRSGQTVCKKVAAGSGAFLYTYYVYDDMGRIAFIVTPKAVAQSNTFASVVSLTNCYTYRYNKYGQVTERTIPDKTGKEVNVYDSWHRPVMSQTPLLNGQGKWAWQVYDSRGRVVMSGFVASASNRIVWQNLIDGGAAPAGTLGWYLTHECNGPAPASLPDCEINQYNYYDDYNFPESLSITGRNTFDTRHNALWRGAGSVRPAPVTTPSAPGMLTATRVRVLENPGLPNEWISTVLFYDPKGNPIQSQTLNAWNTTAWDVTTTRPNFSGQTEMVVSDLNNPPGCHKATVRSGDNFIYGIDGRLASVEHFTDGTTTPVTVADYTYDALGRVSRKWLGNAEVQDYSYDISGRLTGINKDYVDELTTPDVTFGAQIYYDHGFEQPRYDGSVAGVIWRGAGTAAHQRSYGYTYDAAGRMTGADFYDKFIEPIMMGTGHPWTKDVDYSVSDIAYDPNGNMQSLSQRGMALVNGHVQPTDLDHLHYYYRGNTNALDRVEDDVNPVTNEGYGQNDFVNRNAGTRDYEYDADGNLTKDNNKGIETITYNAQDLPLMVNGSKGAVVNTYDASGVLLQKEITPAGGGTPTVYRYLGAEVLRDDDLSYTLHPEGRCRWVDSSHKYKYDFFVKDHLGNVRTVVTRDPMEPSDYVATYENSRALEEGAIFDKVEEVKQGNDVDPQPGDLKIALLDGSDPDRRVGTSLLLKVMAGDVFDIGVDAAYEGTVDESSDPVAGDAMVSALIGALTSGATALPEGEGGTAHAQLVSQLFSGPDFLGAYSRLKNAVYDPAYPKAYLGYAVFDEHMKLLEEESGMIQVTKNAGGGWKLIDRKKIRIPANGYFGTFTVNEDVRIPVKLNNLEVTYSHSTLLEEQHYYPHGLLAGDGNQNPVPNRYLYQGKELQDEAGLQLYDFHARQYDPQIGRFWGIDPMDQFPSGYTGMGNSPANMVDPDGMTARYQGPPERSAAADMAALETPGGAMSDLAGSSDGSSAMDITNIAQGIGVQTTQLEKMMNYFNASKKAADEADAAMGTNNGIGTSKERTYAGETNTTSTKTSGNFSIGLSMQTIDSYAGSAFCNPGKKISLPCFKDLWDNYPVSEKGELRKFTSYDNECAIRLTYDMRVSGVDLSGINKYGTQNGFILGAASFGRWMLNNFGPPIQGSAKSDYANIKVLTSDEFLNTNISKQNGLAYFEFHYNHGGAVGTGHVDLWRYGSENSKGGYYTRTYQAFTIPYRHDVKIWFWPLK